MRLSSSSFDDGAPIPQDVRRAIEGHVLAPASITGRYALNSDVKL